MLRYQQNQLNRSLIGGLTIEAAVDFTGGVPELIDLSNLKMDRERLFYIMAKADDRGAFMGCALGVSFNKDWSLRNFENPSLFFPLISLIRV